MIGKFAGFLMCILVCSWMPLSAQSQSGEGWRFDITPYGWAATQEGVLRIGDQSVELTSEDYLHKLGWSFSLHAEAHKNEWSILLDALWANRERRGENGLTGSTKSFLGEAGAAYRLSPRFEILGGGRLADVIITISDSVRSLGEGRQTWFDPFVGARWSWPLIPLVGISLRGDVGGFGVGSKFSWNIVAAAGLRLGNFSFLLAYRVWDFDYEHGSGADAYEFDMTSHGPGVGLTFHF
jgi:hypothetical protein